MERPAMAEESVDSGQAASSASEPVTPSATSAQTKAAKTSEYKIHFRLHAFALIVGTILGLGVALYVDQRNEKRHKRILIPVLIEGADRQGGQFTLGVSRAMEFAHRYRLDQLGDRQIDPWLLDERKGTDEILNSIRAEDPPIVVGPLRSTPALDMVPRIARRHIEPRPSSTDTTGTNAHEDPGLGIPVILGIPTNTSITQKADFVWRLSPTDDTQGDFIAKVFQAAAHLNAPALIIKDLRPPEKGGNPGYVKPLHDRIVAGINALHAPQLPYLDEEDITAERLTNDVQSYFKRQHPRTIIYLGMPEAALDVLRVAKEENVTATWIFTDSCITNPQELIPLLRTLSGEFFISFQAPPAIVSMGLQLYMFYTSSTGGNVLFALDPEKQLRAAAATGAPAPPPCNKYLAAPTYEVFGFDSYLTALLLLRNASSDGSVSRDAVREKMAADLTISDPLLIGDTYKFNKSGDSTNTKFYLYEFSGDCTSYISLAEVAQRHGRPAPPE
jgi:hypothetical protein